MTLPDTGGGTGMSRADRFRLARVGTCLLVLWVGACGLKAPPQPRERVVPAPIQDVAVRVDPEGLVLAFTLPDRSLDGSPLREVGGYRVVREGPGRAVERDEVRFSVTEQKRQVGQAVVVPVEPPVVAGVYRYRVVPVDAYGSRPRGGASVEFCWTGSVPDGEGRGAGGAREAGEEGADRGSETSSGERSSEYEGGR